MATVYSVKLIKVIEEFSLEILFAPPGYEKTVITSDDVNRPGLQLVGFFDYFNAERVQVMGKSECTFVERASAEEKRKIFEKLLSREIPVVIYTRGLEPFEECMEMAVKYNIPILRTNDMTTHFLGRLIPFLKMNLAPRITRHGVLVEVYGEGLLLMGESGVGKSETAIELVKRGHRLIADDAVEITRESNTSLVGTAPELIRHYIELRGIGVIDVRRLFGMASIKPSGNIDLVVNIELWKDDFMYDRLGLDNQYTKILGVEVPSVTIPVKPGRNLAVIVEVAAMNNRHKTLGFNAALEFTDRINQYFENAANENSSD